MIKKVLQNILNTPHLLLFLIIGVLARLVFMLFVTHFFDMFNMLALSKSVADSGQLTPGFSVTGTVQLYGKIYYEVAAAWLYFLQILHILDIRYIFDTKDYVGPNYMPGLFQFSPPIYQLMAYRCFQFLYDFIFVYFFYQIARLINPKHAVYAVLFWALNPFFIFTTYALTQSDMSMVAFLTGGVYFSIKALQENDHRISKNVILSFIFFAVGGVIKQVPILLIPIALILHTRNVKQFIGYIIATGATYLIVSQTWSPDVALIKHYAIYSPESLALFRFALNGVPVFFFGYFLLLIGTFLFKHVIRQSPFAFIKVVILLIVIIYLSEETGYLFSQFNIWIMPFLALAVLYEPIYAVFFIAPIIGYFKRIHIDNSLLTSSLAIQWGPQLSNVPDYRTLLQNVIQPTLMNLLIQTAMVVSYVLLLAYMFVDSMKKHIVSGLSFITPHITLRNLSIALALLYFIIFAGDFLIKSRYAILSSQQYERNGEKIRITTTPIQVEIMNPKQRSVTALDLAMTKDKVGQIDYFVLEFIDADTKQPIYTQKINDLLLPEEQDDKTSSTIFLKKPVKNKHFFIKISQEKGWNNVYLFGAKSSGKSNPLTSGLYSIYFADVNKDDIVRKFTEPLFYIDLRGKYPLLNIFNTYVHNISMKRSFYILYFGSIVGLGAAAFVLAKRKHD